LFHCFLFLMKRSNFARPGASCWCITGQKRWVAFTTRMAREDYLCSLVLRASNLLTVVWGPQEPCACQSEENMYPKRYKHAYHEHAYTYINIHRGKFPHFANQPFLGYPLFTIALEMMSRQLARTCITSSPPSKQPQKPWLRCRSVHFLAYRNICYICHDWPSNFDVLKHTVHTYNHIYILYTSVYYFVFLPAFLLSSITYAFIIV
jgi:hypothetical protein